MTGTRREIELFFDTKKGTTTGEVKKIRVDHPDVDQYLDPEQKDQLLGEIELLDGASATFDQEMVDRGELSPVFSDFSLTTLGTFLAAFLEDDDSPLPRHSDKGDIDPMTEKDLSAFVF